MSSEAKKFLSKAAVQNLRVKIQGIDDLGCRYNRRPGEYQVCEGYKAMGLNIPSLSANLCPHYRQNQSGLDECDRIELDDTNKHNCVILESYTSMKIQFDMMCELVKSITEDDKFEIKQEDMVERVN